MERLDCFVFIVQILKRDSEPRASHMVLLVHPSIYVFSACYMWDAVLGAGNVAKRKASLRSDPSAAL